MKQTQISTINIKQMTSNQKKYKLAVLKPDSNDMYKFWIRAIEESSHSIKYKTINIESESWLTEIMTEAFDMVLISPPFVISSQKTLLDERVYFISNVLKLETYPDYHSLLTWENKRMLNYFLNYFKLPVPKTYGFYKKNEAFEFIKTCTYPQVAKVVTGAAGLGVKILKNKNEAGNYIKAAFSKGVGSKTGPDFRKPDIIKRIWRGIKNKKYLKEKISNYKSVNNEKQIGFVYFQEFIPHTYEWRCVRIDESFFAHKKMVKSNMASGSLIKGYDKPSEKLLDFVKQASDKLNMTSAAYDIFETANGQFLVNEVQSFFGQSDPHQMLINGTPGRYVCQNKQWIFEEGNFNQNKSYNLRLEHAIKLIDK